MRKRDIKTNLVVSLGILLLLTIQSCKGLLDNDNTSLFDVFGTVTLVTEASHIPLANALVVISDKQDSTDVFGLYRVSGIEEGEYLATVFSNDGDSVKIPIKIEGEGNTFRQDLEASFVTTGFAKLKGNLYHEYSEFLDLKIVIKAVRLDIYDLIDDYRVLIKTVYTDSLGHFEAMGLSDRKKVISFSEESLNDLDLEVNPTDSVGCWSLGGSELCRVSLGDIYMSSKIDPSDYFPLEVGNMWRYDYSSSSAHGNTGEGFSGESMWKVVAKKEADYEMQYQFIDVFTGEYTYYDLNEVAPFDTTQIESDTLMFSVTLSNNGTFEIDHPGRPGVIGHVFRRILINDFPRFNISQFVGDEMHIGEGRLNQYKFSKGIGLTYLQDGNIANLSFYRTIKLLSHDFNN